MKLILFISVLIFTLSSNAQIVNTEVFRKETDTIGWIGSIGLDLSLSKNTKRKFSIKNKINIQYKTAKNVFLFVNDIGFERIDNEDFVNKGVQHLRYNYKFNQRIWSEFFFQNQYNALYEIDFRELAGAGLRLKLTKSKKYKIYFGTLIMYEYEKTKSDYILYHKDWRNSNYLSFNLYFNKNLALISTTYFQPLIKKFSDYRIAHQSTLKFKIAKNLAYKMSVNYTYDRFPVLGVPQEEYHISNGIVYSFK